MTEYMAEYMVNLKTGLLDHARFIYSPNHNQRPDNADIDLGVIHNISLPAGEFGGNGVIDLFTNSLDTQICPDYQNLQGLEVSSHLFIRREGEVIQFVPFHLRAWHAGVSQFAGRDNCNDFSIGIELGGTDICAYTNRQYTELAKIIRALSKAYPKLTTDRWVGHNEIAPSRKTDPGESFDWPRLKKLL